jgi:hypothetical protein
VETIRHTPCDELSWSHCRLLMQVEHPAAREWYMAFPIRHALRDESAAAEKRERAAFRIGD